MGWGTVFSPEVYINKMLFESEYDVDSKIEELEAYLKSAEDDLLICAALSPKDFKESDEDDVVFMIKRRFKEAIEFYRESIDTLNQLYLLRDHIVKGGTFNKDE